MILTVVTDPAAMYGSERLLEPTRADRGRVFNLGSWQGLRGTLDAWDGMIEEVDARTGAGDAW